MSVTCTDTITTPNASQVNTQTDGSLLISSPQTIITLGICVFCKSPYPIIHKLCPLLIATMHCCCGRY
jgi:hypothetical protein